MLRFTEHVQTLKQIGLVEAGRDHDVTTFTVDSPIPYRLDNLIQMLQKDNAERIPQHPSNRLDQAITRPADRFRRAPGSGADGRPPFGPSLTRPTSHAQLMAYRHHRLGAEGGPAPPGSIIDPV